MTIKQVFQAFTVEQQIRGNSPQTIKYYSSCVNPFVLYVGIDCDVEEISVSDVKGYILSLRTRVSSISLKTYVKGIKTFLAWLYDEDYISDDINSEIPIPRAQKKTIDVLTDDEIKRLFKLFNCKDIVGLRNYCICSLMLDSGFRKTEIVNLKLSDLHIPEGYILVNGKGNKQRIVPIGYHTQKHLIKYVSFRPVLKTENVFLSKNLQPITKAVIECLFKKLKKELLVPRIKAHLLRHTFATRYLENGGNIYALQQILGHTSLDMVKRYVHLAQHKNVANFSNFSPLDNLR